MRLNSTLFFISILIVANLLFLPLSMMSQSINTEKEDSDFNSTFATRSKETSESRLVFDFSDSANDVEVKDNRDEPYTDDSGYDIKNITTESAGEYLWVNMSMYDLVIEDIEIYYKMNVADAEAILFRGDGSISYGDKTSDFSLTFEKDTISAKVEFNKLNFKTFVVSGRVYSQGEMDPYGEYLIYDDIDGVPNGIEFLYTDPKDDVKISYTESYTSKSSSNLDVRGSELMDTGNQLIVSFNVTGSIVDKQGVEYIVLLAEAIFKYGNGKGSMKYRDESEVGVTPVVSGDTLSVSFDKSKIFYTRPHYYVTTTYNPTNNKTFHDDHSGDFPFYLYSYGEKMDLEITMFKKEHVTIRLHGDLSGLYSRELRYVLDELGDNNGLVDAAEVDYLKSYLSGNNSATDFFELSPYVDSVPGESSIEFDFENATGDIESQKPVFIDITGKWKYLLPSNSEFKIKIRYPKLPLDVISVSTSVSTFSLNYVYDNIVFKFSGEYKYWEFTKEVTPELMNEYLDLENNKIEIPNLEYYVLKHKLPAPEFGFTIKYNQTLADLDKPKPKNGNGDGGFTPGFEVWILVIIIIAVIVLLIMLVKRKK